MSATFHPFRMVRALAQRLIKDARAVAAVEFAVMMPLVLVVIAGAAEISDGVTASRKVSQVTRTLVDLVSRQTTANQPASTPTPGNPLTSATLSSLMTAAATLLNPQPSATLTMTVSAVDIKVDPSTSKCCIATVRWSYTQGGTLRPCNTQLTALSGSSTYSSTQIPASFLPAGTQLASPVYYIIADVSYTYQPIISVSALNFAPTMQRTEYMMPRSMGQVTTGTLPSSGTQNGQVCY